MFYRFMRGIAKAIITLPRRVEYRGLENIPKEGPVLLISNHVQYSDAVLMGLSTKREMHFLAKGELFHNKALQWFFHHLNCIPIDRDHFDKKAIKTSIQILKDGGVLGVFPEGTRSHTGDLLPFKAGVSFIASQAPCTVVPMAMTYQDKLFQYFGKKVIVNIGKSFPYAALEGEKRKETQERMLKLQEDAVRTLLLENKALSV